MKKPSPETQSFQEISHRLLLLTYPIATIALCIFSILGFLHLPHIADASPPPTQAWVARYNGQGNSSDFGQKITTDSLGNVYVTGQSGSNYLTVKYDSNGTQLWTVEFDSGQTDIPVALSVDAAGNVYVTGQSYSNFPAEKSDYVTVKYDASGNRLWTATYDNGGYDRATALTLDSSGNVYVTGLSSNASNNDYATIKYDTNGRELWIARHDSGGNDSASLISLDSLGNVYVTGQDYPYLGYGVYSSYAAIDTVIYDSQGNERWVRQYADGNDIPFILSVDELGTVSVTVVILNGGTRSYSTIRYDSTGNLLGVIQYTGGTAILFAFARDNKENIYIAGVLSNGLNEDYGIEKYNSSGTLQWTARYDNGGADRPSALAVDGDGNVYVTGWSTGATEDYATIEYDSNGNQLWVKRYDAGDNDRPLALALDSSGNVYVTGQSYTNATSFDYATIKYSPPHTTPPPCTANCYSNVLFLPGIMGSRLFEKSSDCGVFNNEKERWVSTLDCDHARLGLDATGKSINPLYTKEGATGVIDDAYSFNIYQSFMNDLKKWKETDHTINDYSMIAYDWRLSLEDILQNGATSTDGISYSTSQGFTNSYIYKQLKILADSSKTKKVTIVAHSNGGLVTKALIQKLKETNNPLYDRIDKIIFVAVPQAGTPDAIGGILYGTNIGLGGIVIGSKRVRDLLHNMPMGYNLLPSRAYIGSSTPLIEFAENAVSPGILARYGDTIDTYNELVDYLLGSDGRSVPPYDDLSSPAIANSALLSNAETVHTTLNQWAPATSTMVYEIAGWGVYTPAGLRYEKNKICIPGDPSSTPQIIGVPSPIICDGYVDIVKIEDKFILGGDDTVIDRSAHLMPTSTTTQRWWVNLGEYNNDNFIKRVHKDIFEVGSLRSFIHSIIISSSTPEQYITNNPLSLTSTKSYIRYDLHSPLNLNIYDQAGNHTGISTTTGLIEEGIKGGTYYTLGDTKTIIVPADTLHTVKLDAYASGSFTLDLEELQGDMVVASTTYEAIPTATTTQATLVWTGTLLTTTALAIDFNGDSTTDATLKPTLGGTTVYDIIPPEARFAFDPATNKFSITGLDNLSTTTINTTATSTTIIDEAGNTTIIPFLEYKEEPTQVKIIFNTIIYNGVATTTPKTTFKYEWKFKNDILKSLSQEIHLKDVREIEAKYKQATNETKIVDGIEGEKSEKVKLSKPGIAVVTMMTDRGQLLVGY